MSSCRSRCKGDALAMRPAAPALRSSEWSRRKAIASAAVARSVREETAAYRVRAVSALLSGVIIPPAPPARRAPDGRERAGAQHEQRVYPARLETTGLGLRPPR
jgi:hypothetical protein